MANERSAQLREQGVAAAKARQTDEARRLLGEALKLNPRDATAWLYLASVSKDKKQRLLCLQKVLQLEPENEMALKAVRAQGIDPADLLARAKPLPPAPQPEPPAPPREPDTGDLPSVPPAYLDDDDDIDLSAPPPLYQDDDDDIDINAPPPLFADDDDPDIVSRIPDFESDFDDINPAILEQARSLFDDEDDYTGAAIDDDIDIDAPPPVFDDDFEDDFDEDSYQPAARTYSDAGAIIGAMHDREVSDEIPLPTPPPIDPNRAGVPIPDEAYLAEALGIAEQIVARATALPPGDVEWVRKERNRAGERDIVVLRAQIAGIVAGIVFGLIALGAFILAVSPEAQAVVLNIRTRTPTPSPTITPTNTLGATRTPSATLDTTLNPTLTPSPTLPSTFTPVGVRDRFTPEPTALELPPPVDVPVLQAAQLIAIGNYDDAIPTLEVETQIVNFNPNPYYVQAVAYARQGDFDSALATMTEAEERQSEVNADERRRFQPYIDMGFAEVYIEQARDAFARGDITTARGALAAARDRLENSIAANALVSRAHVLLATSYLLEGGYEGALAAIDFAQTFPELLNDQAIVQTKAEIYFAQGSDQLAAGSTQAGTESLERAILEGRTVIAINPFNRDAHELRVRAALVLDRPGLAVIFAQDDYLFHFPDDSRAWQIFGDARLAEGNTDLAFDAYEIALANSTDDSGLVNVLVGRSVLFVEQRQYGLALDDLNRAYAAQPTDDVRVRRMRAAYLAGDFDTARADAEALREAGYRDDAVPLTLAQITVAEADPTDRAAYQTASNLLGEVTGASAEADTLRAQVNLTLGNLDIALNAIERAIVVNDSGTRRYLRGQIYEARGDFELAIIDYQWVISWDSVFGFSFADDAATRAEAVRDRQQRDANTTPTPSGS